MPEAAPIRMRITYTDGDLIQLEFFRDEKRLLWIDLTREQARDWATKVELASHMVYEELITDHGLNEPGQPNNGRRPK